jgi:UDP-GlcNAc:undecaprenyl-phosphate GlcNAc-1-phosphate transferase
MLLPALAFLSALIVTLMIRVGALDHPVARSSHALPTPKGGGVGIVAAFAIGMAMASRHAPGDAVVTVAAVALAAISYADDFRDFPFWLKLAAQLAACAAVIAAGALPDSVALPGHAWSIGLSAPFLWLAWLLFVTNAVNFMDGLNGLAAGSAAIACVLLASVAGLQAAWPECLLAAGIAGFLPLNYPRARIFMGDVGSQFLGFLLATLALRHADDPGLSAILPLSLAPMLLDAGLTLVRRARRGERLTQAHRDHFYQVANRAGMPAWLVTAMYWMMAACGGRAGVMLGHDAPSRWEGVALPVALAILPFAGWAILVTSAARRRDLRIW